MAQSPTLSQMELPVGQTKFIIVTGGTVSGLGKGTAISSLGVLLKAYGLSVTCLKIDPYLNIDAGTMSPYEHGEVFVLDDGGECDLDLGNYERFLDLHLTKDHNITTGKIYQQVLQKERNGEYLGKTVQMVPHVTDEIQKWILKVANKSTHGESLANIVLIELGGTVGDIESAVYLEALQEFQHKMGRDNVIFIHVGFVPVLGVVGEQKTKPCQHSVKLSREAGVIPDFLFIRSEQVLEKAVKSKLSLFCQMPESHVISMYDVKNSYTVPLLLHEQSVGDLILNRLGLTGGPLAMPTPQLDGWKELVDRVDSVTDPVNIVICGKYTGLSDSYLSVIRSLQHAALEASLKLNLTWIEASKLEEGGEASERDAAIAALKAADGVLVPGGFGDRGVEGKIKAAQYCIDNKKPYFGICLGMQTAVINSARNRLGLSTANSTEFDQKTDHPVVIFMPEGDRTVMGGTMRLGARECDIEKDSLAYKLYGSLKISERHRHRYEVNPDYVERLSKGLKFSGKGDHGLRMEIVEISDHPFFIACQFHPEFTSRPKFPNPLFLGFVLASANKLEARLQSSDDGLLHAGSGWNH
jgi:CTP synthase